MTTPTQRQKNPIPDPTTFDGFMPRFDAHMRSQGARPRIVVATMRHLRRFVSPECGHLPVKLIGDPQVAAVVARVPGRTPKGVDEVLSAFARALDAALELGVIDRLPCNIERFMCRSEVEKPLPDDEREQFVEAAQSVDARALGMVLLGVDAGLQGAEMLKLGPADIDLTERVLIVRAPAMTRADGFGCTATPYEGDPVVASGRNRVIPMTKRLARALAELNGTGLLLTDDNGRRATQNTLRPWLAECRSRTAIQRGVGLNALRNCFATRLSRLGTPAPVLRALTGYSPRTWPFVANVTLAEKRKAIALLERLDARRWEGASADEEAVR